VLKPKRVKAPTAARDEADINSCKYVNVMADQHEKQRERDACTLARRQRSVSVSYPKFNQREKKIHKKIKQEK
jgi:hypothetical protein